MNAAVRPAVALLTGVLLAVSTPTAATAGAGVDAAVAGVARGEPSLPMRGAGQAPGLGAPLTEQARGTRLLGATGVAVAATQDRWTSVEKLAARTGRQASRVEGRRLVEGTARDVDSVVETSAASGRIMEVIHSPNSDHAFRYHIGVPPGSKLFPQADGSILIGQKSLNGDSVTIAVDSIIGAPWAVDARGKGVKATYSLGGDGALVMSVDLPKSWDAYPVVADPTVTKGGFRATWSIWAPTAVKIYLNKARTADAEDLGSGICIAIAFIPVLGPVVAALCGAHNVSIRATSRYGYCQWWDVESVTRKFIVRTYRGGFCS